MIHLQQLGKTYRSPFRKEEVHALDDVTFSVDRGEVVGIAGLNGAGKSTLISLLLGFLQPSRGQVRIDGRAPREYIERHGAAYLDELVAFPPKWTVTGTFRRSARLARIPWGTIPARVDDIIQRMALESHRKKRLHQLSKGNLQRVGLGQAIISDHDLVILDEPTYGLDPVWTHRFRDIVRDLRRPSRAILIASHNLDELERLADRVIILHRGQVQRMVHLNGAGEHEPHVTYRLKLVAPHRTLRQILPAALPVSEALDEWHIRGDLLVLHHALGVLLESGIAVDSFTPESGRLESEFRLAIGSHG